MNPIVPRTVRAGKQVNLYSLGDGVLGYAIRKGKEVYIPVVNATTPGNGDVGRWLDALATKCVLVGVINNRLKGMLVRRQWEVTFEKSGPGDVVDTWRWRNKK